MSDQVFNVSTQDELYAALNEATGGETIVLDPGDYGELELITSQTSGVDAVYGSPVTITSADSTNLASFSGMDLRGVSNLSFDNVKFDYTSGAGSPVWLRPFSIKDSSDVAIRNSVFDGDLAHGTGTAADGKGTGKGLTVGGSSNVVIEGNEFLNWHRAAIFAGVDNLTVAENDVHDVRSDGFNFIAVNSVLIEGNYFHDFDTAPETGDHADMIQFWTNGTSVPTTDVVIRGNVLDVGDGDATQSIFMRNDMVDRGLAGEEMFYQDILIEENVILNSHTHGITVGETDGLVIRNNSVLDADASLLSSVATPKINVASLSTDVTIEGNATAAISGHSDQPDWMVINNALVQNTDREAAGFYETEFIHSTSDGRIVDYIVDPNGTIGQLGAGASRLHLDSAPEALRPAFDVASDPDADSTVVLDAGYTYGPAGAVTEADAQFIWDFGDGSGATGQVVKHAYADAGRYEATLTVVMFDGTTAKAVSEIGIMGEDVLSYDAQTGLFQAEGYGESTAIADSGKASLAFGDTFGVDLGGTGAQVGIGQDHLSRLFGADSFDLSMTLRADTLGSIGEVARVHGNFILSIAPRGEVNLQLWTDSDGANLTTTGVTVNDGADHDIRVAFDSELNSLDIYVDGALAGATEVDGAMRGDYPRSLVFGNPWGHQNFDGTLTAFDLETGNQDYPDYEGEAGAITGDAEPVGDLPEGDASADDTLQPDAPTTEPPADDPAVPETSDPGDSDTQDSGDSTTQDRTELPVDDTSKSSDGPVYHADFARIGAGEEGSLVGDAYVAQESDGGSKVVLDGQKDYLALGRIEELESSQQLNVSLTFQRSDLDNGTERIVWNHMKFGIAVKDDSLLVHIANNEQPFHKAFDIGDAGIDDTGEHSLNVAVDAEADRLQVVLDGNVVLDEQGTDLDFVGNGGHEWGWSIGTAWNRYYEGSVSEFELDDQAVFVDDAAAVA